MHNCASILDSIAKKTYCFLHGASLHHCSFSRMIFTRIFVKLAPVARRYHMRGDL